LESEQFDLESRRVRKEDLKKIINKGTEVGTQILLDDAIERQAYIIKNGLNDRVNIDKSNFIIGRDKSISHFVIMKSSISKQHATISNIENKYYITDNGSSNGTYLNCIRLQPNKRYELNDKDNIIFADENYQFRLK
jgi:pSer/pThr/pTyr-binding forkhead associated (FHA) protein